MDPITAGAIVFCTMNLKHCDLCNGPCEVTQPERKQGTESSGCVGWGRPKEE
jgi:hypothetical protein